MHLLSILSSIASIMVCRFLRIFSKIFSKKGSYNIDHNESDDSASENELSRVDTVGKPN